MYSLQSRRSAQKQVIPIVAGVATALVTAVSVGAALFFTDVVTWRGIPYSVLARVWQDAETQSALASGDPVALHQRLSALGIEYDIKTYYRARISDPVELDRHIHQIFYDWSGYVGENYIVDGRGKLVLKDVGKAVEIESCPNC
jgi:hypothetical protein